MKILRCVSVGSWQKQAVPEDAPTSILGTAQNQSGPLSEGCETRRQGPHGTGSRPHPEPHSRRQTGTQGEGAERSEGAWGGLGLRR